MTFHLKELRISKPITHDSIELEQQQPQHQQQFSKSFLSTNSIYNNMMNINNNPTIPNQDKNNGFFSSMLWKIETPTPTPTLSQTPAIRAIHKTSHSLTQHYSPAPQSALITSNYSPEVQANHIIPKGRPNIEEMMTVKHGSPYPPVKNYDNTETMKRASSQKIFNSNNVSVGVPSKITGFPTVNKGQVLGRAQDVNKSGVSIFNTNNNWNQIKIEKPLSNNKNSANNNFFENFNTLNHLDTFNDNQRSKPEEPVHDFNHERFSDDSISRQPNAVGDIPCCEIKEDIIAKILVQPLSNGNQKIQVQTDICDIKIALESKIIEDFLKYFADFRKIYHFRYLSFQLVKNNVKFLKSKVEKDVFSFRNPSLNSSKMSFNDFNNISGVQAPLILNKDSYRTEKVIKVLQVNHTINKTVRPMKEEALKRDPYVGNDVKNTDGQINIAALFLKKLTEFILCHEIGFMLNMGSISFSLNESSIPSLKNDLLKITSPKGIVKVALNVDNKLMNMVNVFGFVLETSSKFQAIYFLFKV